MARAFPKGIAPSAPPCIIDSRKNISTTHNRSIPDTTGCCFAQVSRNRVVGRSLRRPRPLLIRKRQWIGYRGMFSTRCIGPDIRPARQADSIEPHRAGLASSQVIGSPLLHHTVCTLAGTTGLASIPAFSPLYLATHAPARLIDFAPGRCYVV